MNSTERAQVDLIINGDVANKNLKLLEAAARKLRAELRNIDPGSEAAKKAADNYKKIDKAISEVRTEVGLTRNAFNAMTGSLDDLTAKASEVQRKLASMAPDNPEIANLTADYKRLTDEIEKQRKVLGFSHDQVKQSASGYNGLNNSIAQITREMPAFANSAQTGFMAISNNLPILIDEINRLKIANREMQAQGGKTPSLLSQLASGFFSWQTVMSVGITLITVYGKEIGNFIGELIRGNQTIDASKAKFEAMNAAYASDEVKDAATNYFTLIESVKEAKNGFADKKEVVDKYNETIGKTLGFAKDINDVEDILVKNKSSYIQSIVDRATANNLLAKSAELMVKKVQYESGNFDVGLVDVMLYGAKTLFGNRTDAAISMADRKRQEIKQIEADIKQLTTMASGLIAKNPEKVNPDGTKEKKPTKTKKEKKEKQEKEDKVKQDKIDYEDQTSALQDFLEKSKKLRDALDKNAYTEKVQSREQDLLDAERFYDELLDLAMRNGNDTTEIIKQEREARNRINETWDNKELQSTKDLFQARMQAYASIAGSIANLSSQFANQSKGFVEIQRMATLAQIAFSTAAAIAKLTEYSAANPANALTGGAAGAIQFASGIGQILANIAQATAVLNEAPGFYEGGFTSGKPGKFAGVVHGGEYVINHKQLQNPYVYNFAKSLENQKSGQNKQPTMAPPTDPELVKVLKMLAQNGVKGVWDWDYEQRKSARMSEREKRIRL